MVDPLRTLLFEIESDLARLVRVSGASLVSVAGTPRGENREERFKAVFGRLPPPGYAAFCARYDGGVLGEGVRLLSWDEAAKRLNEAQEGGRKREGEGDGDLRGLWPILDRGGRLFALDAEGATDGEWPVVEVADKSVDRAGTTFLRFFHALMAELLAAEDVEHVVLARELCRRDPGLASHWVDLVDALARGRRQDDLDEALDAALRTADPVGPALAFAAGVRAFEKDDAERAWRAFQDALTLEPLTARDDDARLDAAAILIVLADERGDQATVARARDVLASASASTGAYWRGEAMRAWVDDQPKRAQLAVRVVRALLPDDEDIGRLSAKGSRLGEMVEALLGSREALDRGAFEEAAQKARTAVSERPDLGLCHAALAEALNAQRDRGALESARKATELNPSLVEGWRELGDALLEARQANAAEDAYRKAITRDPSYGLGHAKLAQALLEQGRSLEALDAINIATERGSDPFFLAAVRGDILAEMSRHREAAEAYDQALRIEPEDHWVLHQAAIEHSRAGNDDRAAELFEHALKTDQEGCHQTLIDYGDLLRRVGRIGDAVRLYRRAVAACPNDSEWRQVLREAERELMSAPN